MTPDQKGSLPLRLEKLFYEMQDRIFTDGNMSGMQIPMSRSMGILHCWKIMNRFNSGHKLLSIKPKMK